MTVKPKISMSSFWRNVATIFKIRTAKVVVFMPPAVEPGDPPISISIIITDFDVGVIAVRSAVLKPAVLVVTD